MSLRLRGKALARETVQWWSPTCTGRWLPRWLVLVNQAARCGALSCAKGEVHTQLSHAQPGHSHSSGALGSEGPGTAHTTHQECTGAQPGPRSLRKVHALGPNISHSHPPSLPAQPPSSPSPGPALGLANLGAGPPGPGPLCGRMAGRAGAQSKLNLHLGAPSGQSSRRSHRSPLMASSKCGAAASAPRVRAHPPSARTRCKMVFTKVNIGCSARWPPLPGPHLGCHGLLLESQLPLAPRRKELADQTQARHPRSPRARALGRENGRCGLGIPWVNS